MGQHNADRQRLAEQVGATAIALAQLGEDFDKLHGLQGAEGEALLLVRNAYRSPSPSTGPDTGPDAAPAGALAAAPMTPGRLAKALRLPSASVTAVIDRLEQAGHVRRVRDTKDRRRVLLKPTAAALRAQEAYWGGFNERVMAVMEAFTGDELNAVDRFLTQVAMLAMEYRTERDG